MPDTPRVGRFAWHELLTTDPDGAIAFYGKVVGWKVQSWEQDSTYRMWMMGNTAMGAVLPRDERARATGAGANWLPYVVVADADQSTRRAQALGGRVWEAPESAPNVGTWAVLADPLGAVFAIIQPAGGPGGPDEPPLGDFSWHELATRDWQRAWEFYRGLFGWEEQSRMDMGPAGPYFMFKRAGGSRPLGGIYNAPPEPQGPPRWLCYARVPNADRAAETVTSAGGRVVNGPMEVAGGDRVAMCVDPQGAAFAVHAVKAKAKRKVKKKKAKTTKRPKARRRRR